jgi:hypothetical protein
MVSIAKIDRISIMADAAEAITNGIEETDIIIIIRGMCWFLWSKRECHPKFSESHTKKVEINTKCCELKLL